MELEFLEAMAQYGPFGLWTAFLLWMIWLQRKESKKSDARHAEALQAHQDKIMERLSSQEKMIKAAIEKIDQGVVTMRDESPRGRILRLQKLAKK